MRHCLLCLVIVFLSAPLFARLPALIPYQQDGKWGYYDTTKTIVVRPHYDTALLPEFGLARVAFKDSAGMSRWGLIDERGQILLEPRYWTINVVNHDLILVDTADHDSRNSFRALSRSLEPLPHLHGIRRIDPFHAGRARFARGSRLGFLDSSYAIVVPATYSELRNIHKAVALVREDGNWGAIGPYGQVIIPPDEDIDAIENLDRDLLKVSWKGENKFFGLYSRDGQYASGPEFDNVYGTSDGMALVHKGNLWLHVDSNGREFKLPDFREMGSVRLYLDENAASYRNFIEMLPNLKFSWREKAGEFRFGLTEVNFGGRSAAINKRGELIIPPYFDEIGPFSEGLAFMRQGHLFGYIDTSGTVIIDAQFDEADDFINGWACVRRGERYGFVNREGREFSVAAFDGFVETVVEGFVAVKRDGLVGFVDTTGRVVVKPKYRGAENFSEGMARVNMGQYEVGFVNTTGREVIPPRYYKASDFKEGRASVISHALLAGYIDRSGSEIIPLRYSSCRDFSEGFAAVSRDGGWTCIDTLGNELFPLRNYANVRPFYKGFAIVDSLLETRYGKRYYSSGCIDTTGKEIIPPRFHNLIAYSDRVFQSIKPSYRGLRYYGRKSDRLKHFEYVLLDTNALPLFGDRYEQTKRVAPGLAAFWRDGKAGLVRYDGREILKPTYSYIDTFSHGRALVYEGGDIGIIDMRGREIHAPRYRSVEPFEADGFARVQLHDSVFFVNREGKRITFGDYDGYTPFSEGLAGARQDSLWSVIDTSGRVIIAARYTKFEGFQRGVASVVIGKKNMLINRRGEVIASRDIYDTFTLLDNGLIRVVKNRRFGLIDSSGKAIAPLNYQSIKEFSDGYAAARREDKWCFIDSAGNEVVAPQFSSVALFKRGHALVSVNDLWGVIDEQGRTLLAPAYERRSIRVIGGGLFQIATQEGSHYYIDRYGKEYRDEAK